MACVIEFILYESFTLNMSDISSGFAAAKPNRTPARLNDFEKVRPTIKLG
jgi:hypothetical protein